jgi:hypothetical protein
VDTIKQVGDVWMPDEGGNFDHALAKIYLNQIEHFCAEAESQRVSPSHSELGHEIPHNQLDTGLSKPNGLTGARWKVPCADQAYSTGTRFRATAAIKDDYDEFRKYIVEYPLSSLQPRTSPCNNYYCSVQYQYYQRPFISHSGYVGLSPARSNPGDGVYVVFGANIPFVFREHPDGYCQLIGEAYVDGIMDGEFMLSNPAPETLYVL